MLAEVWVREWEPSFSVQQVEKESCCSVVNANRLSEKGFPRNPLFYCRERLWRGEAKKSCACAARGFSSVSQIGQLKARECIYIGVLLAEIDKGNKS